MSWRFTHLTPLVVDSESAAAAAAPDFPVRTEDPIEQLKRNVACTLNFLDQERNDHLPPCSEEENDLRDKLATISSANVRECAVSEVTQVIRTAEDVVNDIKHKDGAEHREDSNRLAEEAEEAAAKRARKKVNSNANVVAFAADEAEFIRSAEEKSAEVFKFLEYEPESPLTDLKAEDFGAEFIHRESSRPPKSGIPVAKRAAAAPEKEKDIDLLFSESPLPESRIPVVRGGSVEKTKVKTIKKHSKDPLKEFVKLSQDVNWDAEDGGLTTPEIAEMVATATADAPLKAGSKIPVFSPQKEPRAAEAAAAEAAPLPKRESKIPVATTPEGSGKQTSGSSNATLDSDSEAEELGAALSRGGAEAALAAGSKKGSVRTLGSSSGSDIALHEAGAELSDDESGK